MERLRRFFGIPAANYVLLAGVVLISVGGVFALQGWGYRASVISGVGGSLVAAAIVTLLSPANSEEFQTFKSLGIRFIKLNRNKIDGDNWCRWIRDARQHCTMLGIAHHGWCGDGEFPEAVRLGVGRGVDIKFFFLNPLGALADQRAKEDLRAARNTKQEIRDSIRFMWQLKSGLPPEVRGHFKLFIYEATPSSGTTWVDEFMIVTHYLAGFPNVTSPTLTVVPAKSTEQGKHDLYDIYRENVRKIEEKFATEITETNIDEISPPEEPRRAM